MKYSLIHHQILCSRTRAGKEHFTDSSQNVSGAKKIEVGVSFRFSTLLRTSIDTGLSCTRLRARFTLTAVFKPRQKQPTRAHPAAIIVTRPSRLRLTRPRFVPYSPPRARFVSEVVRSQTTNDWQVRKGPCKSAPSFPSLPFRAYRLRALVPRRQFRRPAPSTSLTPPLPSPERWLRPGQPAGFFFSRFWELADSRILPAVSRRARPEWPGARPLSASLRPAGI